MASSAGSRPHVSSQQHVPTSAKWRVQVTSSAGPSGRGAARGAARGASGGRSGGRGAGGRAGGGGRRFDCDPRQAPVADRQVVFKSTFPEDPVTAIIGGGLAGLACAHELARRGLRACVFDTGEHGVGGRLATRSSADGSLKGAPPGLPLVFDHAAQYFTATDPEFQAMVDRWVRDGVVRRWQGPVGTLRDGRFSPDGSQERYIARGGMRSLAQYLAGQASQELRASTGGSGGSGIMDGLVEVRRPQWVSGGQHTEDGWQLVGRGREQGTFDALVIAHNGKCANRLAAPLGAPAVYGQLKRLKLSANWALMVAFAQPVAVPGGMEGAFVQGSEVLSWAANNTAKLGLRGSGGGDNNSSTGGGGGVTASSVECWTLFSTQAYGRQNKVPQEAVPPEVAERVTAEMLAAFERSLGLPQGSLPPVVFTKTQLWGAALPLNSPRVPCIWDPASRVGVCGDWVSEGGSMQAAALSGKAMAERIDASRGRRPTDIADLAMGLTTPLKAVEGEEIGQFPAVAGKQAGKQAGKGAAAAVAPAPAAVAAAAAGAAAAQQRTQQPAKKQQPQQGPAKQPPQQQQSGRPERGSGGSEKAGAAAATPQLLARPARPTAV